MYVYSKEIENLHFFQNTYRYNLLNIFANMYHVSIKYKIVTLLKKVSVNIQQHCFHKINDSQQGRHNLYSISDSYRYSSEEIHFFGIITSILAFRDKTMDDTPTALMRNTITSSEMLIKNEMFEYCQLKPANII